MSLNDERVQQQKLQRKNSRQLKFISDTKFSFDILVKKSVSYNEWMKSMNASGMYNWITETEWQYLWYSNRQHTTVQKFRHLE